jgi:hypothetical protein
MNENMKQLQARVERAAEVALAQKKYVSPIDVLVGIRWLPQPVPLMSSCPVNPRNVSSFQVVGAVARTVGFCDAPRSCSTPSPTRLSASCWSS